MIGVAFVFTGWFIGRLIYGYVHRFAFRLSQEIHAAYIEIYPENPPHFYAKITFLLKSKNGNRKDFVHRQDGIVQIQSTSHSNRFAERKCRRLILFEFQ